MPPTPGSAGPSLGSDGPPPGSQPGPTAPYDGSTESRPVFTEPQQPGPRGSGHGSNGPGSRLGPSGSGPGSGPGGRPGPSGSGGGGRPGPSGSGGGGRPGPSGSGGRPGPSGSGPASGPGGRPNPPCDTPCATNAGWYLNGSSFVSLNSTAVDGAALCPAGTQCLRGCCARCPAGIACPAGTVSPTGDYLANLCPAGHQCAAPDYQPRACDAGAYCTAGGGVVNCTALVERWRSNATGESRYDGSYCGRGSARRGWCPAGYHCPTPAEKYLCPEGSYCPRKTQYPVACRAVVHCPGGSDSAPPFLWPGLIIFIALAALALPHWGLWVWRRARRGRVTQNAEIATAAKEASDRASREAARGGSEVAEGSQTAVWRRMRTLRTQTASLRRRHGSTGAQEEDSAVFLPGNTVLSDTVVQFPELTETVRAARPASLPTETVRAARPASPPPAGSGASLDTGLESKETLDSSAWDCGGDQTQSWSISVHAPYLSDRTGPGTMSASASVHVPYPSDRVGSGGAMSASASVHAPYPSDQVGSGAMFASASVHAPHPSGASTDAPSVPSPRPTHPDSPCRSFSQLNPTRPNTTSERQVGAGSIPSPARVQSPRQTATGGVGLAAEAKGPAERTVATGGQDGGNSVLRGFSQSTARHSQSNAVSWDAGLEAAEQAAEKGPPPGSGVEVAFRDLSLRISSRGRSTAILNNVSGVAPRSSLTAVMGTSGCGKTSLINALCGRAYYSSMTGTVLANGVPVDIKDHRDAVCFVCQDDIVHSDLTVLENFVYTGTVLLPRGTPLREVRALAHDTLAHLELDGVKHTVVGSVDRRGVSGGQRKRVNIGIELMRRPQILVLDEPTSGLDASGSMKVCQVLAQLCARAVTVVAVIHQPRFSVFTMFHHVILLGYGGNVVYCGPPQQVVPYFSRRGFTFRRGENPADVMLDIASGSVGAHEGATVDSLPDDRCDAVLERQRRVARLCAQWKAVEAQGLRPQEPGPDAANPLRAFRHPHPLWQFGVFLVRGLLQRRRAWRTVLFETLVLVLSIYLAILVSGPYDPTQTVGEQYQFSLLTSLLFAVLVTLSSMRTFADHKLIFYRQAAAGISISAYFWAQQTLDVLVHGVQALWVALVHYDVRTSRVSFWNVLALYELAMWFCTGWGYVYGLCLPERAAYTAAGLLVAVSGTLFSGTYAVMSYKDLYGSAALQLFVGAFSSARWVVEWTIVTEGRAWPLQYGYRATQPLPPHDPLSHFAFEFQGLALADLPTAQRQSVEGWGYSMPWMFAVGAGLRVAALGLVHVLHRNKMCRPSLGHMLVLRLRRWGLCTEKAEPVAEPGPGPGPERALADDAPRLAVLPLEEPQP